MGIGVTMRGICGGCTKTSNRTVRIVEASSIIDCVCSASVIVRFTATSGSRICSCKRS